MGDCAVMTDKGLQIAPGLAIGYSYDLKKKRGLREEMRRWCDQLAGCRALDMRRGGFGTSALRFISVSTATAAYERLKDMLKAKKPANQPSLKPDWLDRKTSDACQSDCTANILRPRKATYDECWLKIPGR